MAEKFHAFTNCPNREFFGCVTAIDGWVCHTRKPTKDEVADAISYRNRKNCWGVVVLAGCDAELRYTMFSVKASGSTNDVTAWDISENNYLLTQEKLLPEAYFFIGDEAFVCSDQHQFLVPYSGRSLSTGKDAFNHNWSAMRQCVERCARGDEGIAAASRAFDKEYKITKGNGGRRLAGLERDWSVGRRAALGVRNEDMKT
jgi:hypothetical protein